MNRLALLLLALLVGCAPTAPASESASAYPPTRAADVVVYQSEADVPGAFDILGYLPPPEAPRYGAADPTFPAQRQEAARLGANALLVYEGDEAGIEARVRQALATGRSFQRGGLIAIYVRSDATLNTP